MSKKKMTKWSDDFLIKLCSSKPMERNTSAWQDNINGAHRLIGFPKEIFKDLQERALKIHPQWQLNNLMFLAGVCIGWNEAKRKKK